MNYGERLARIVAANRGVPYLPTMSGDELIRGFIQYMDRASDWQKNRQLRRRIKIVLHFASQGVTFA